MPHVSPELPDAAPEPQIMHSYSPHSGSRSGSQSARTLQPTPLAMGQQLHDLVGTPGEIPPVYHESNYAHAGPTDGRYADIRAGRSTKAIE